MISVNDAKKILSEHNIRGEIKTTGLKKSLGLIVSENIYSPIDVPSFNNSAMDGYAMGFDGNLKSWEVISTIQAGDTSHHSLAHGQAVRIFTGAKMPQGADTVIPQELIEIQDEGSVVTCFQNKINTGSNVRLKGSQCKEGNLIVKKGALITPGTIGLLASVGLSQLKVYTPPSVAYVITGNELKEVGSSLVEGEIYNSNGPMLEACLTQTGIEEISAYKASDDKTHLKQIINDALEHQEVLILSGGISVGDYDFVKECLQAAGVKQLFYKIKQRPGKPLFVGKKDNKWIFALPGNPASVLSCFHQYVKPCMKYMIGHDQVWKPDAVLALAEDHEKKAGLTLFMKAKRKGNKVEILGGQQSFNLQAFSEANCLVELEEESEIIKAESLVNVYNL